jgi:hypothetical protein
MGWHLACMCLARHNKPVKECTNYDKLGKLVTFI